MKSLWNRIMKWLAEFFWRKAEPPRDWLVLALTLHTASLEMRKDDYTELAPVKGMCGPFRLYGNSLPVFIYRVFEKSIMEFIQVRVEVSKPDRIEFFSTIDSVTAPERHGEAVETKERYKQPFFILARNLYRYFPLVPRRNAA